MVAGARKTRARARKEKRARAREMKQARASRRGSAWPGAPARAQEAHSVAAPRRPPPSPLSLPRGAGAVWRPALARRLCPWLPHPPSSKAPRLDPAVTGQR